MVNRKLQWIGLILLMASLACTLSGQTGEPQLTVEISTPVEGSVLEVGQEIFVVASAVASEGVDKVYITLNGEILGTEEPDDLPPAHVTNFGWTPLGAGDMVLAVVAVDGEGTTSEPVYVNVQVVSSLSDAGGEGEGGGDDAVPTDTVEVPTNTPESTNTSEPTATDTQVPTDTPTVTPSPTSDGGGGLVIPPIIVTILPTVETVWEQVTVSGNSTGSATVTCPSGTVLMGGGFATNPGVYVYTHNKTGNGWRAYGANLTVSSKLLNVYAVCGSNFTDAVVQQVFEQVTVPANDIGNAVVSCPFGSTVIAGGFASKSDGTLKVYNSTKKDNGWQAYARNSKGSGQALNAYAICLSTPSTTSSTIVWESVQIAAGATGGVHSTCSSGWGTGGGFALQDGLEVFNSTPNEWNSWEGFAKNNSGTTRTMNVYTVCLTYD